MYLFYLEDLELPITPSRLEVKINNLNETITLLEEGEVNILKQPGLSDIKFEFLIPQTKYPFVLREPNPTSYLQKLEDLKNSRYPFQFIIYRVASMGKPLFDSNFKVSLEDYSIVEDANEGLDLRVSVNLKQFRDYSFHVIPIDPPTSTVTTTQLRSTYSAPQIKIYTVKSDTETLWNIAKQYLGDGERWIEIYDLNRDTVANPNSLLAGQILFLP